VIGDFRFRLAIGDWAASTLDIPDKNDYSVQIALR
jgi:hypothetical protein